MNKKIYKTKYGQYFIGDAVQVLKKSLRNLEGKVQLLITSPPFPLNAKKEYGNFIGSDYKKWFANLAPIFSKFLKKNGSIVIEMGNAWKPKKPIQSLLSLESLIKFLKHPDAHLRLCQEFICYNPARLPSPAQWVTVNRIRAIDSYTHVWWMAKSDFPKADNRRILRPYSKSMRHLLKIGEYNAGRRPSEHVIGKRSFLKDNKGSIMHNFIPFELLEGEEEFRLPKNVLRFSNTISNDYFSNECRRLGIQSHPARMPLGLASFFINFLTEPGDIVLDPFAGSNTTGYCSEKLHRKWVSIEIEPDYSRQSIIRFKDPKVKSKLIIFK